MRHIAALLILLGVSFASSGEKPKWLNEFYPLELPVGVKIAMVHEAEATVTKISNQTKETLSYRAYKVDKPRLYRQSKGESGWDIPMTHWCGTGLETFSIPPGESIVFQLPVVSKSSRIFTLFYIEDTQKGSLVLVAGKS